MLRVCDYNPKSGKIVHSFAKLFPFMVVFCLTVEPQELDENKIIFFSQSTSLSGKHLPVEYLSKRAWLVTRGKISSACVLQTLCRPNKASFFHLSAFLRCKIVIKRDKVLTWLGSSCFLWQVLEKTRSIDLYWFGWLYENRTFISIAFLREKFSSGSVQKVPLFWVWPQIVKA